MHAQTLQQNESTSNTSSSHVVSSEILWYFVYIVGMPKTLVNEFYNQIPCVPTLGSIYPSTCGVLV